MNQKIRALLRAGPRRCRRGRPGNGADRVPKLASSSTRENRRRAFPELLEAVLQADLFGCQVNRH